MKHGKSCCVVAVAGGSGSGKTTFAQRIVQQCKRIGVD